MVKIILEYDEDTGIWTIDKGSAKHVGIWKKKPDSLQDWNMKVIF